MNDQELKILLRSRDLPPGELEARLLTSVGPMLAKRRELHEVRARRVSIASHARGLSGRARAAATLGLEMLAFDPRAQAAGLLGAIALALVLVFQSGTSEGGRMSSLPDFPKFNDVPARYDAEWRAERASYEKEVLDAHERYSGGL